MMHLSTALTVIGSLFLCTALLGQSAYHEQLRKGDRAYLRDQYKEAEMHYRKAADSHYADPKALYNLGNALYQQGQWDDAAKRFEQAAQGLGPAAQKADALHNLGNARMQLRAFDKAVEAYEQSLRLRPADPATKQNLQMAKKRLAEQQQQQGQQHQEKQDKQGQGDQDPNKPRPDGQNAPRSDAPQQEQPQQNQPNQQDASEKLKAEEAKRLLETAIGAEDRKNAKKYRSNRQPAQKPKNKKDW